MNYEEAIQKAAKLLRLATSSNPNEAALAATRAQEIMDRFKIDSIALDSSLALKPEEAIKNFGFDPIDTGSYATWKGRLCVTIAEMNQSICYRGHTGLAIIGRPSDVNTIRYIYNWLVREVEALHEKNCLGCGRTYSNNYRIGVQETVCKRLKKGQQETRKAAQSEAKTEAATTEVNEMALVRVNNAIATIERRAVEVRQWQKQNVKLSSGGSSRARYDSTARELGRRDGHNVRLQPSRGNLGNGKRALTAS